MEFKKSKKFNKKHDFNLSIDNLAIPEIHTHKQDDTLKATKDQPSVNYDTAIPEIHIKNTTFFYEQILLKYIKRLHFCYHLILLRYRK